MNVIVPQPSSLVRAVTHLTAVDLRRFRWLLSGVLSIELVRALLVEGSLHVAPPTAMPGLLSSGAEVFAPLLDLLIVLVTAIATAIVVQADHPTDARAFWRTRPIPPAAVALAKISAMTVLFVAIPAAINAIRLLAYGAPPSAFVAASLQIAVMAGLICVPAWLVAIVTRTLPRFFGAMLAAVIVSSSVMGTVLMIVAWTRKGYGYAGSFGNAFAVTPIFDWQHTGTHGWWGGVLSTVAGLAILAAHYRVRRLWITIVALLVLIAGPAFVPARQTELRAPTDLAKRIDGQLTLSGGLEASSGSSSQELGQMTVHVTGLIGSPSLPADVSGSVRLDRLEVHSGGVRVPVEGAEQCCLNRGPIGVVSAIAASPSYPFRRYDKTDVFTLPESAINGLRHGPLQLAADAIVSFTRHRLAGSIPLRPGGSVRTDRYLLEVLSLERYPPRMTLVLLRFTRFPSMATVAAPRLDLFLTDSARRSAAWIAAPWPIATYNAGTTVDNWSRGRTWAGRFTMMFDRQTEVSPDAHLAVVESFDIGTAHTRLTAADVPIQVGPWGAPIY